MNKMRNLSEIRTEIDSIDEQIIELFKKRMDCAKEVGNYKKANNIPVLNQARENEILDAIEERGGEYGSYARLLYSNIMELSRALQHNIVGSGADIKEVISNVETEIPKTRRAVKPNDAEGWVKTSVSLRASTRRRLKAWAAEHDMRIQEVVDAALETYLGLE